MQVVSVNPVTIVVVRCCRKRCEQHFLCLTSWLAARWPPQNLSFYSAICLALVRSGVVIDAKTGVIVMVVGVGNCG